MKRIMSWQAGFHIAVTLIWITVIVSLPCQSVALSHEVDTTSGKLKQTNTPLSESQATVTITTQDTPVMILTLNTSSQEELGEDIKRDVSKSPTAVKKQPHKDSEAEANVTSSSLSHNQAKNTHVSVVIPEQQNKSGSHITGGNVTSMDDDGNKSQHNTSSAAAEETHLVKPEWNLDSGALIRMFYVVVGVTGVILAFFVLRAVRMRSRNLKSRKYGIISTPNTALELEPLDRAGGGGDVDDEEDTYFDAHFVNRSSHK